ncbi:MAG: Uma2 family endonuclease [Aquificae bacterium]|nr:Uma2 family endonuclease [Aquificota bacterium]
MGIAHRYLPKYTLKDYESWEGDWELIDGIPYALAFPSFEHQRVVGKIFRFLDEQLEKECKDCVVGIDTDYVIDEHTVVRPDVFMVCGRVEGKILKTPKVIFEVVSESTSERDEGLKFELYEREGVEYYIMVFPNLKKAKAYKLVEGRYRKLKDLVNESLELDLEGCEVSLDFAKVFGH